MSISRTRAQDYAETILNRPGGELAVTLKRGKAGATLLYRGRALTRCYASRVGDMQSVFMAEALGVKLPPVGGRVTTKVPGGVLYRAVAISSLDLRRPEARQLLLQLLATAAMQRTVMGGAVD